MATPWEGLFQRSFSAEGAAHPHLAAHPTGPLPSIPDIPFVEFHVVLVQQMPVLLLERARAMMFLLALDVFLYAISLRLMNGKGARSRPAQTNFTHLPP